VNYEDIKRWCLSQLGPDETLSLEQRQRAKAILVAVEAASAPTWLSDAAEALGLVRPVDGAPMALNWTQVIQHIRELREDRDALLKISGIVNGALNGESPLDREQRATKALYLVAEALGRQF
jgi:hypothetical protein